jgi:hypothetical protein
MHVDCETELTFTARPVSILTCGLIYVTLVVFFSPSTSHHFHEQIPDLECFVAARGVALGEGRGGERCGRPRRQSPRGGKNDHFKFKKSNFARLANFKLLNEIKRKSINDCNFLNCANLLRAMLLVSGSEKPGYLTGCSSSYTI